MQRRGGHGVSIRSRQMLLNPVEAVLVSCNQLSRAATVPEICFIPSTSVQPDRTKQGNNHG